LFCLSSGAKKWGWMRPPRAFPAAHFETQRGPRELGDGTLERMVLIVPHRVMSPADPIINAANPELVRVFFRNC
jgi:hypothetical protein